MREGRALQLGSPTQRALLGFLLLHANEPVSRDRDLVQSSGAVWVLHGGSVSRVEPATNTATVARRPVVWAIVHGEDSLWVQTGSFGAAIERLAASTNAVLAWLRIDAVVASRADSFAGFSAGTGAVSVDPGGRAIFKFSPGDGHLMGSVDLGRPAGSGVAFGGGAMWVLGGARRR